MSHIDESIARYMKLAENDAYQYNMLTPAKVKKLLAEYDAVDENSTLWGTTTKVQPAFLLSVLESANPRKKVLQILIDAGMPVDTRLVLEILSDSVNTNPIFPWLSTHFTTIPSAESLAEYCNNAIHSMGNNELIFWCIRQEHFSVNLLTDRVVDRVNSTRNLVVMAAYVQHGGKLDGIRDVKHYIINNGITQQLCKQLENNPDPLEEYLASGQVTTVIPPSRFSKIDTQVREAWNKIMHITMHDAELCTKLIANPLLKRALSTDLQLTHEILSGIARASSREVKQLKRQQL